ncbi:MAG: hypothetical protein ACOCV1_08090 [Bacillota bacterium]
MPDIKSILDFFIFPDLVNKNQKDLSNKDKFYNTVVNNDPIYKICSFQEKSEFWNNLVEKCMGEVSFKCSRNESNRFLSFLIFKKVSKLIEQNKINIFFVLEYFLEHIRYQLEIDNSYHVNNISVDFEENFISVNNGNMCIPYTIKNVPLKLVPNLAYLINSDNSMLNVHRTSFQFESIFKNRFKLLKEVSVPKFNIFNFSNQLDENKNINKKLINDFLEKKVEESFVTKNMVKSLVKKLNPSDKEILIEYIKNKNDNLNVS